MCKNVTGLNRILLVWIGTWMLLLLLFTSSKIYYYAKAPLMEVLRLSSNAVYNFLLYKLHMSTKYV
jgi:hypothetical protein